MRLFTLLLAPLAALAAERPNVIFILADDLGAHDLGCFGSTFYETPNIDRLAKRGTRFTQAYAASPLCSPTRASILVGQYPARIGITAPVCHINPIYLNKELIRGGPNTRLLDANSLSRLKPEYFTLAEALKEAGYATAHFGKWHLGHNLKPADHFEPKDQGFDSDFPHAPNAAGPGNGYLAPWKFIKDPTITDDVGVNIEDRMSKEAAKYIAAHKDKPFYLNYWAYSVHSPWNARADHVEHFKAKADPKNPQHNALYAGMVKSLDDGVGRIMQATTPASPTTPSSSSSPITAATPTLRRRRTRRATPTSRPPATFRSAAARPPSTKAAPASLSSLPGQGRPRQTRPATSSSSRWTFTRRSYRSSASSRTRN